MRRKRIIPRFRENKIKDMDKKYSLSRTTGIYHAGQKNPIPFEEPTRRRRNSRMARAQHGVSCGCFAFAFVGSLVSRRAQHCHMISIAALHVASMHQKIQDVETLVSRRAQHRHMISIAALDVASMHQKIKNTRTINTNNNNPPFDEVASITIERLSTLFSWLVFVK